MENFIDYILFLLLIIFIAFTGMLIFLLYYKPRAGLFLIGVFFASSLGAIGLVVRKYFRKKRLGKYYGLVKEISQARKEISRSTKQLERTVKKVIKVQFPKLNQLCREAQKCVDKILEIEKTLHSLNQKSVSQQNGNTLNTSFQRYQKNIRTIQLTKNQYVHQIQQVLRFLQELNSQILSMKYTQGPIILETEIIETMNELLQELQEIDERA